MSLCIITAWTDHSAKTNMKKAQRKLHWFCKAAVWGTSTFFSAAKTWLLTPFRVANRQPDGNSVRDHLPHFAGDPPWQPKETMALLLDTVRASRDISSEPPFLAELQLRCNNKENGARD